MTKADGGGLRFDEGKPKVELLPGDALLELGRVYAYGAKKYKEARNFERGMPYSKVVGPLLRHMFRWMAGQDRDAESGELHLSHVAWNALTLLMYEVRGLQQFDDMRVYTKKEESPDAPKSD